MKKDDNLYKCVCVPPLDFSRENFGVFQGKGCNDDLSQARWNWLIMIFKYLFFCIRCTAATVPENLQTETIHCVGRRGMETGC